MLKGSKLHSQRGILPKFKLIKAFMVFLGTSARMKKNPIKTEGARVLKTFSLYEYMGIFSDPLRAANSATCGRIKLKFELLLDLIVVLFICKNEEGLVKK